MTDDRNKSRHSFKHHGKSQENQASKLIQGLWRKKKKKNTEDARDYVLLPILIIPGIASSGLKIEESGVSNEDYTGQRVWMNAALLVQGRLDSTVLNKEELERAAEESNRSISMIDAEKQQQQEEEDAFVQAEDACQVRSAWLYHISLADDMVNERPGNKVRPYQGVSNTQKDTMPFIYPQKDTNSSLGFFGSCRELNISVMIV
jgi:hypothetical protein